MESIWSRLVEFCFDDCSFYFTRLCRVCTVTGSRIATNNMHVQSKWYFRHINGVTEWSCFRCGWQTSISPSSRSQGTAFSISCNWFFSVNNNRWWTNNWLLFQSELHHSFRFNTRARSFHASSDHSRQHHHLRSKHSHHSLPEHQPFSARCNYVSNNPKRLQHSCRWVAARHLGPVSKWVSSPQCGRGQADYHHPAI